jgi:hypothetical protein
MRLDAAAHGVVDGEIRSELDGGDVGDAGPTQPILDERGLEVGTEGWWSVDPQTALV